MHFFMFTVLRLFGFENRGTESAWSAHIKNFLTPSRSDQLGKLVVFTQKQVKNHLHR